MVRILERTDQHEVFGAGENACIIYDLVTHTPDARIPTAGWYRGRDGKIAAVRAFFDPTVDVSTLATTSAPGSKVAASALRSSLSRWKWRSPVPWHTLNKLDFRLLGREWPSRAFSGCHACSAMKER
jgi:hypothetical protein